MKRYFYNKVNPISERHVQAIWYDAKLRPSVLHTVDGEVVKVLDPGVWNLEAGPDFHNAVLEIGDAHRRVCGDVEIHIRPSDWIAHNHSSDPRYGNVVAHVTWQSGTVSPALNEALPDGCVSICIGKYLRTRLDFSPDDIDLTAYPYANIPLTVRPCEQILKNNYDLSMDVLFEAGIRRLQMKARRIKTRLVRMGDRVQVFYEEVMGSLGFKYNQLSFRVIAEMMPWRELPHDKDAILECLKCVAGMQVENEMPWRRANVRPNNTPEKRLSAAATIFSGVDERFGIPKLLRASEVQDLTTRVGQKEIMNLLCVPDALGCKRAAAVMANVIIPFALAENRISTLPNWIFPEDLCAPARLTAYRLFGRDHNTALYANNGLLIQGLIQIHRDYCLNNHADCDKCGLVCGLVESQTKECDIILGNRERFILL